MALEQFSDVVQRCEALPNDSYTSDDHNVFTIAGRTCIEEGNSPQVLSIVLDEKNQNIVRSMGWNLLPPLIQVLLKKEDKNLPQCLSIFNHLLETCRPKELLIGLLEQVEHDDPDRIAESLHLLLNPLQKVLLCLGSRKASSLGMTLSSVLDQLVKLPVPVTKEQEEDDVFSLCRCCTDLIQFVRPFVEEARLNQSSGNQLEKSHKTASGQDEGAEDELRTDLLKFCMKTLSQPLLDVQIRDPDTLPLSPLRTFASEILDILGAVGESLPSLLFHPLLKRKEVPGFLEEEVHYPKSSLASLAHLVFVHHLAADTFPSVFSPLFCLRSNMEHISILLSRPEDSRLQKGLELYEKSMVRVEDGSLPADLLEIKTFLTVPQDLVKVMTVCPNYDLRTKGLKVFQLSIDKFHPEAKYRFFQYMLRTSNHSGVEGYVIKNIKNQIDAALQPGNSNIWFEGAHLLPLLRKVFSLPDGPETDLLQNLDRVMESLNLLRYLIIRDKVTENQTGIWTELYKIEDTFMKPLRVGLNMSRAHYERELQGTMENKKKKTKDKSVLSVSVGGDELPKMTSESQIQALHSALHTFDMIESVLVRIEELTEVKDGLEPAGELHPVKT
ncbi:glomulin, FKBP associated protein a [Girardinichthys multiradiatus]|uniref:glomulin, FKBP associated protein a n=1 Tax=Girardinichthys multiradiatus TaxID=208333 RepID=UPI001FAE1884|nr:glomulin, FKBP associated protein a [Girardinichthys multiradiatus]XP_047224243.1 glomulin, FKBP associated protein a [Girardinichthys multiradiatus]XP_047224244.1 glomulin, FKBP associated protein a [Girardinichthys multiradiatus]